MGRVPFMRGTPGHPYNHRIVLKAKHLLALKKRYPRRKDLTYVAIAKQCGVLTPKTIRDWEHKIMTVEKEQERMRRRGHRKLLTDGEEEIAAGFIVLRSINSLNTATPIIRAFFSEAFGINAKHTWLYEWAKRRKLSWRRPQRHTYQLPLSQNEKKIVKFLNEIRARHKRADQIATLDKTYLRSQPITGKQLSMTGRCVALS